MTNEEKAIELDKKFREAMFSPKEYHFTDCLLEMAEWKVKQAEKAFCELCQTKGLRGCNGNGCDNLKLFKSKIE